MSDEKKVSKAPPPIHPLRLSPLKLPPFDTNVKGPTNWNHWRHVSTVEIWQALLLSLNIEPPGKGWLLDNAPGRTGNIPRQYLEDHGLNDEFDRRWSLVGNRLETLYAAMRSPRNAELTHFIRLPLFAAWAVEFEWKNLPPEFVAMAIASDKQPVAPASQKGGAGGMTGTKPSGEAAIWGKLPNTSMGKLAIKAAWLIEGETNRAATAKQVMTRLQEWADGGHEPATLLKSDKKNHAVKWITGKRVEKSYDIEACGKTLETWTDSRA